MISLDALAKEAVRPETEVFHAIVDHFGKGVLASDGTLDRRKLRGIITEDSEAKKDLERLTHPEILRLFEQQVATIQCRHENAIVVAEVPLLIEVGIQDEFDVVVLVVASSDLQKRRLMARDGTSAREADALLAIQMPWKKKVGYADHIVRNIGSLREMEGAVRKIYRKISQGSGKGLTRV